MAFKILENTKIFEQIKPFPDNATFQVICFSYCRKNDAFILKPNNNALLQVEPWGATSVPPAKDHRLGGSLQRNQVNLAIFDV